MNYYSRWLEVLKLKIKSESVIALLKVVFSRFGVPREIVADIDHKNSYFFLNSGTLK